MKDTCSKMAAPALATAANASIILLTLFVLAATPGFSGTIAYDQAAQVTGNQNYFGALGMDFQVLSPIIVSQIGVFSNNPPGSFGNPPATDLNAAIFALGAGGFSATTSGGIIAGTEVSFVTTGTYSFSTNWLLQNISPVVLLPGFYTIVAQGYNASDPNGNQGVSPLPVSSEANVSGVILFGGVSRFESPQPGSLPNPVDFPSTLDGGPSNRYYAGNFVFAAAPVNSTPEPGSLTLFAGGLVGLGFLLRRRRT
jgi:hypothetical protein